MSGLFTATRYVPIEIHDDNSHTSRVVTDKEFTAIAQTMVDHIRSYNQSVDSKATVLFNPLLDDFRGDVHKNVRELKAVLVNVAVNMSIPIFLGCKKILYINGYDKNTHTKFTVTDFNGDVEMTPVPEVATSISPILAKLIPELTAEIYIAKAMNSSDLFTHLYGIYGANVIETNKPYTLGDNYYNLSVPSDLKFDCVYFNSVPKTVDGSFDLDDLKQDFARYCTDDFILIDGYREKELQRFIEGEGQAVKRIHGTPRDISALAENLLRMQTPPASESSLVYDNVFPVFHKILNDTLKVY